MRRILLFVLLAVTSSAMAQKAPDLRTEINQSSFDKILASMDIPLTLFEHNDPFPAFVDMANQKIDLEGDVNKGFGYDRMVALFLWAVEGAPTAMGDNNEMELKNELKNQWAEIMGGVNEIVANYEYAVKNQSVPGYKGPMPSDFDGGSVSISELKKLQKSSVAEFFKNLSSYVGISKLDFVKAHLAYAKAELTSRPSLTVNSPVFKTTGIKVKVTATGELWMKLPVPRCCKRVLGVCVWWCFDMKWVKVGSITVSPTIGADVTVNFSVSGLKIFASGSFDRLFLDYFILREINLAGLANNYLRNKTFELYDVSKFVASIPYINKKFRIESINVPARTGGITVEVNVTHQ